MAVFYLKSFERAFGSSLNTLLITREYIPSRHSDILLFICRAIDELVSFAISHDVRILQTRTIPAVPGSGAGSGPVHREP